MSQVKKRDKWAALFLFGLCLAPFLLLWKNGVSGGTIYVSHSPTRAYKVEIVRRKFLIEHAVYFNAWYNEHRLVHHKLLFTGDLLDTPFEQSYPNYDWISANTLLVGDRSASEPRQKILIQNEAGAAVNYLLLESYSHKAIIFDLPHKETVWLDFPVREKLSCQGAVSVTGLHFSSGVELMEQFPEGKTSRIEVRISSDSAAIGSSDLKLKAAHCCAPDRPGPGYEWMY